MNYEDLLIEYDNKLKIKELPLKYNLKGLYKNGRILIKSDMSDKEKYCILAEEIGHHYTSSGNILDQDKLENRKQEVIARRWGYEKLVGIVDLINAWKKGINNRHDLAEYLNVTESFLLEAIEYYKTKYGTYYIIDSYCIMFEPNLRIIEYWG
ncbi:ImmA/IrrE family metallo-endopeptidase [Clostridium isatidis]|uniref:ImmA/IrrE family metallo-endopeptidase n=1 Tax=Clostridium isatidis TaxID=182773 RepID=UPI003AAE85DF